MVLQASVYLVLSSQLLALGEGLPPLTLEGCSVEWLGLQGVHTSIHCITDALLVFLSGLRSSRSDQ